MQTILTTFHAEIVSPFVKRELLALAWGGGGWGTVRHVNRSDKTIQCDKANIHQANHATSYAPGGSGFTLLDLQSPLHTGVPVAT